MKRKLILLLTVLSVAVQTGVCAAEDTVNAALNMPASASSSCGGDNLPQKANDGINDNASYTYWKSAEDDEKPSWQVDLGLSYSVEKIELEARLGEYDADERSDIVISAAENEDFSDERVLAETAEDYGKCLEITPISGRIRFIRVRKTAGGALSIGELRAIVKKSDILQGAQYNNPPAAADAQTDDLPSYILPADAAGTRYEKAVRVLSQINVMKGYPNGSFQPEKGITRAEFTKAAAKLLGYTADSERVSFSDVPKSHWAHGVIETAVNADLVNGVGGGRFEPDSPVTVSQAVKIVVSILGYKSVAELSGGWPEGYEKKAADLQLLRGMSAVYGNLIRGDAAQLLYNALDTKVLIQTSFGEKTDASTFSNRTLLTENLKIDKAKGTVTATRGTSLTRANGRKNYLEIDNTEFVSQIPNPEQYFGMYVEYYYKTEDDDPKEVVAVIPGSNDVLEIDADEIKEIEGNTLKYGEKKVSLLPQMDVIYNGAALRNYTKADLKPADGGVRLIDNDGDGIYDVYMVTKIDNYVVNSVNLQKNTIVSKNASRLLEPDFDNDLITLTNKKTGKEASIEEIREWNVLSVTESVNTEGKKIYNIVISDDCVTGKLTSAGDCEMSVDGVTYKTASSMDGYKVNVGDEGNFYLDSRNRIAAFDISSESEGKYGFLKTAARKDNIGNTVQFRIFTEEGEWINFDGDDKKLKTDGVHYTDFAGLKAHLVQSGTEADSVMQPVKYKTGADGKITSLYTAAGGDEESISRDAAQGSRYYKYTGIFTDVNTGETFAIGKETVMIRLPDDLTSEKDYEVLGRSSLAQDSQYTMTAYDGGEERVMSFLVFTGKVTGEASTANRLMLVDKVVMETDDDGEAAARVYGLFGGKYDSFFENESGILGALKLKRGDVIKPELTASKRVKSCEKMFYRGSKPEGANTYAISEEEPQAGDINTDIYMAYGKVMMKKDNILTIKCKTDKPYKSLLVSSSSSDLNVYYYDSAEDKIKIADASYLFDAKTAGEENASTVLVRIGYRNEYELIIFD